MRTFTILLLASLLVGCSKKQVGFRDEIQPILNNRCVDCHRAERASGKILLTGYDNVMSSKAFKSKKPIVIPGNPSESWLYLLGGTTQPHFRMPPDSSTVTPLTESEVKLIGKWILEGAKNN